MKYYQCPIYPVDNDLMVNSLNRRALRRQLNNQLRIYKFQSVLSELHSQLGLSVCRALLVALHIEQPELTKIANKGN